MTTTKAMIGMVLGVALIQTWAGNSAAAQGTNAPLAPEAKLKVAKEQPNTWVVLDSVPTGGRSSPFFFYEPGMKKFFLGGGAPSGASHFDEEIFDPLTCKWLNAYPAGAPYTNATGVTDAPAISSDFLQSVFTKDKQGVSRYAMFSAAYGTDTRAHFQWAYDPDSKKLFAYIWNQTGTYDPVGRTWSVLTNVPAFSKGSWRMVWGNMCYDPINKEVLSIGGASEEKGGTPGTYVFSIAEQAWKKVDPGSKELKLLYEKAAALRHQCWALVSACRGRFFVAESASEAKVKLSVQTMAVESSAKALADELAAAKLSGDEAGAVKRAARKLMAAQGSLKTLTGKLDAAMSAELIAAVQAAHDELELVEFSLAPEPTGRAHSQPAFDVKSGKIVLFGGSGLDRCYADTWVYDPKARSWAQKYPTQSPSPRAGHALVGLPKSGKVALAGGYTIRGSFRAVPHQLWVYDVAANEWKLLLSMPPGPVVQYTDEITASPKAPFGQHLGNYGGGGSPWAGAAMADDLLVMVDAGSGGRNTWACQVDPSVPDIGGGTNGVPPDTMSFSYGPADWERDAKPDPVKTAEFYQSLVPNVWTNIPIPKGVPRRDWNTTAYDPDRQQFLWWGGGHVTYMGTDVAHYSVRGNAWTLSYAPDLPTEPLGGYYVKAALSFQDRPQIPCHGYQAYAYDQPSGRMFYLNRGYHVAERRWDAAPYPGLQHKGAMNTLLESTPTGVVALSELGLFRFEWKDKAWKKLPWIGSVPLSGWCDGNALCYDSKRDCLWFSPGDSIARYDCKSGTVERVVAKAPKALGQWALWREQVYIPGADLILLMQMFPGPDGKPTHVAFDPAANQYYFVDLGGKPGVGPWSAAIHYDTQLGVALIHDGGSGVWALKLDRKTARMSALE